MSANRFDIYRQQTLLAEHHSLASGTVAITLAQLSDFVTAAQQAGAPDNATVVLAHPHNDASRVVDLPSLAFNLELRWREQVNP